MAVRWRNSKLVAVRALLISLLSTELMWPRTVLSQIAWQFTDLPGSPYTSSSAVIHTIGSGGRAIGTLERSLPTLGGVPSFVAFSDDGSFVEYPLVGEDDWLLYSGWAFTTVDGFEHWSRPWNSAWVQLGWVHRTYNTEFELVSETMIDIPGSPQMGLELNRTADDHLIIVGTGNLLGEPINQPTFLLFEQYTLDGTFIQRRYHTSYGGLPRQVVQTATGFSVAFFNLAGLGPPGFGKVLRFDNDFNYQNGFALPDANGSHTPSGNDSLVMVTGLFPLEHGRTVVSGYYDTFDLGTFTPSYQACLLKFDSAGTLLDRIEPAPAPERSESLQPIGLRALSDSTFLWCYFESDDNDFQVPYRYAFAVVDTNLNVVRNTVFDTGFPEQYIELYEVLPTSDGGYVVSGTISDVPATQTRAYVAKINGTTGIAEPMNGMVLSCFPNPGTTFNLHWTGPPQTKAVVEIFDARGRLAHRAALSTVGVQLNCDRWGAGLYTYRVVQAEGRLLQQGKWMKE